MMLTLCLPHVVIVLPESPERSHAAARSDHDDRKGQVFREVEGGRAVEVVRYM